MRGEGKRAEFAAALAVFMVSAIMHAGTFAGLDSDLQTYSLHSMLIYKGWTPYIDFFDIKPPLYYYMLLPGNLLGGRFVHFFLVHLVYVSALNALIYLAGRRLGGSALAGMFAWMLYCFCTVIPFFDYGNLNGGIVYATSIFSLCSVVFAMEMIGSSGDEKRAVRLAALAGVFSGLAFATRFGMSQNLVYAFALVYLVFKRGLGVRAALVRLAIFVAGATGVVLLVMAKAGWPLKAMYDDLIVFNSLYSGMQGEGTSVYQMPALRVYTAIVSIMAYSRYAVICALAGALAWMFAYRKKSGHYGMTRAMFVEGYTGWLALYFVGEVTMLLLQGTGTKQYPYFSAFVPLCIMGGIGASSLIPSGEKRPVVSWAVAMTAPLLLLLSFGLTLSDNMDRIKSVSQWPEGELVSAIKRNAESDGDLYTLSIAPYLYLESGIAPPRSMVFTYYVGIHWNFAGTRQQQEADAWQRLSDSAPRVVVLNPGGLVAQEMVDFLGNGYALAGIYNTSYVNMDQALLFVLDKK